MDKQQKFHSKTAKVVGMFLASAMAVTAYTGCSAPANSRSNGKTVNQSVYSGSGSSGGSFFSWNKSGYHSSGVSSGSRGGIGSSSGSSS